MAKVNQGIILGKATELYAKFGFEEFSIRKLAEKIPISHSVIYHYFSDEEVLLKSMFDSLNHQLGKKRAGLPQSKSAWARLKQRIEFQVDNAEPIVAVLKYYLTHRPSFKKNARGFVPDRSALHIEEVLEYGIKTGEFSVSDLKDEAKVITHAINGFLLEYYPHKPQGKEKQELIDRIFRFLKKSLKGGEKV
jgi:AcrR family transcriptional regulator